MPSKAKQHNTERSKDRETNIFPRKVFTTIQFPQMIDSILNYLLLQSRHN